jgi:hypothetical protein
VHRREPEPKRPQLGGKLGPSSGSVAWRQVLQVESKRGRQRCFFPAFFLAFKTALTTMAFVQSGPRWLGISDLIAEPEGPTFISYRVARGRLNRLRFVTQDPNRTKTDHSFGFVQGDNRAEVSGVGRGARVQFQHGQI